MVKATTKSRAVSKNLASDSFIGVTLEGKEVMVPTDEHMRSDGMATLSSRIRHLESLGVPTAGIAKIVKRSNGQHPLYQHVRNVLNTPLKNQAAATSVA